MPPNHVPAGYPTMSPYVVVRGAGQLADFLKAGFGGIEVERMTRKDGRVGHAEVRLGDSIVMMGEPPEPFEPRPGNFHLYVPDVDATFARIVRLGATVKSPPVNRFYGDRVAQVADPFGNLWSIATHIEDVPPDELARRGAAEMS